MVLKISREPPVAMPLRHVWRVVVVNALHVVVARCLKQPHQADRLLGAPCEALRWRQSSSDT